ncbi:flagellar protein FlgA [Kineococcus sp. NUM-3379]
MTLPPPRATRLRAPSWRDPRLLVGLSLVLGSVVLGARVVATADRTVPVWAVVGPVAAGQSIGAGNLRVAEVRLGEDVQRAYLPASAAPATDWVALRTVAAGELLPRASVGRAADLAARPVSLPLDSLPAGVAVGGQVDVWTTGAVVEGRADLPGTAPAGPEQLLAGVEVSAVSSAGAGLGTRRSADVQVLVPAGRLPGLLTSLASGTQLVVVPVPGTGAGA